MLSSRSGDSWQVLCDACFIEKFQSPSHEEIIANAVAAGWYHGYERHKKWKIWVCPNCIKISRLMAKIGDKKNDPSHWLRYIQFMRYRPDERRECNFVIFCADSERDLFADEMKHFIKQEKVSIWERGESLDNHRIIMVVIGAAGMVVFRRAIEGTQWQERDAVCLKQANLAIVYINYLLGKIVL